MRKLELNGLGAASGRPDTAEIAIKFFDTDFNCAKALERVKSDIAAFDGKLNALNLGKDVLKTDALTVDQQYDYRDNERIFKGYCCHCTANIDMPLSSEALNAVLDAAASFGRGTTFSVSFTVKDKDALAGEALSAAVRDAFDKAQIIASAAGVKLGAVQEICPADIIRTEPRRNTEAVAFAMRAAAPQPEYVPDDIKINARVRVVWEIE